MAQPGMKKNKAAVVESPQTPEYEQIASLAYRLWEARGCPEGSSEDDWFQAEQELTAS